MGTVAGLPPRLWGTTAEGKLMRVGERGNSEVDYGDNIAGCVVGGGEVVEQ